MGEGATSGNRIRSKAVVVLFRLLGAVVALAAFATLTADLAGKSTDAPASVPGDEETPYPDRKEEHRRPRERLVHAGDPTVYDAQEDLKRCSRSRWTTGASSRKPGLGDDIRTISRRLERIRELEFARPVETRLVSRAEVGERFARKYRREYTPRQAEQDARVLAALRLVPVGTDIRAIETGLLTEGVAGFYNPRKRRLFAASTAGGLTPFEEVVLAHELDHALVDQVLRLPRTLSRDPMLGDVTLAHQALAEGDAVLAMARYAAERLPDGEYEAFLARFGGGAIQARTDIPYVLRRASAFPYYEGLLLACFEWRTGGWDALNEMYLRPPSATADVVFPSRYRAGVEVELPPSPSAPGPRWKPVAPGSLGVFDLMLLLENADLISTGETVPGSHVDAVRGWGGGVLRAWLRGDETTVHVALVDAGVQTPDGRRRRLCGVLRRWLLESFAELSAVGTTLAGGDRWDGGGEVAALRCEGRMVELAKGPHASTLRRLLRP